MSWLPPYNGGSTITAYSILFQPKDTSADFTELLSYCDGKSESVLVLRYCEIPMSFFRGAPLNLEFDDLIVFKVRESNLIGDGDFSDPNIAGVRI